MKRLFLTVLALAALLVAPGVLDATSSGGDSPTPHIAEAWLEELAEIEKLLVEGKTWRAHRRVGILEDRMVQNIIEGQQASVLLGSVAALRAIALAARGKERDAVWKWHIAVQFRPDLADMDLSRFGEAGELLQANSPCPNKEGKEIAGVQPPEVLKKVEPIFPLAQYVTERECTIEVRVDIPVDGVPVCPQIIKSAGHPTNVYAALEAMQGWRFRPATLAGKPVECCYVLSVDYRIR